MSRSPRATGWTARGLILVVALEVLVAGCSEPGMSLQDWERVWQQTVDRVADAEAVDVPEEECSEILTFLREQRPRLSPLPAEGLEKPVDSWFELAEAAFFDCPPDGETLSGWRDAFEQLSVVEAEVATVLARHR